LRSRRPSTRDSASAVHEGLRFFDAGQTAVLDTTDGHTLTLNARRIGNLSLQQHYSAGVKPEEYRVVVAKGVVSPRAAYSRIAKEIVLCDTPGAVSADLSRFEYGRRRRPLFPFEPAAAY
jgi:microcystin degradation protein MlrC